MRMKNHKVILFHRLSNYNMIQVKKVKIIEFQLMKKGKKKKHILIKIKILVLMKMENRLIRMMID